MVETVGSRRRFLGFAAGGLGAVAAAPLLGACSASSDGEGVTGSPEASGTGEIRLLRGHADARVAGTLDGAVVWVAPGAGRVWAERSDDGWQIWSHRGTSDDEPLVAPGDAVVDARGHVHVVDQGNGTVEVLDAGDGSSVRTYGTEGDGALSVPVGIAVDEEHAYVVDLDRRELVRFTLDGEPAGVVGAERVRHPRRVEVGGGAVWVLDGGSAAHRFDVDGEHVDTVDLAALRSDGTLASVHDLAVDDEALHLADAVGAQLVRIDHDWGSPERVSLDQGSDRFVPATLSLVDGELWVSGHQVRGVQR